MQSCIAELEYYCYHNISILCLLVRIVLKINRSCQKYSFLQRLGLGLARESRPLLPGDAGWNVKTTDLRFLDSAVAAYGSIKIVQYHSIVIIKHWLVLRSPKE